MEIRELTTLSRDELIEIILRERKEAESVGAGGVSLMGEPAMPADLKALMDFWDTNAAELIEYGELTKADAYRACAEDLRRRIEVE